LLRQEEFLNGKNVGQFLEYNMNGTLCIKGFFAEGAIDDSHKEYCGDDEFTSIDNPGIATRHYCFSSPREGKWTYYADNGKKYCEGCYKNNKRIGKWIFYSIYNGKIERQKDYENGENRY
jgi:antitoxin component YwqK of YwqJK toxin-antitoxin module